MVYSQIVCTFAVHLYNHQNQHIIMKKIAFLLIALMACTVVVHAQDYKRSAGIVVGTMEGFSYKRFYGENIAIQTDIMWKIIPTTGTTFIRSKTIVDDNSSDWTEPIKGSGSMTSWSFECNPNMIYQKHIKTFDKCGLYWYAGGGVSVGFGRNFSDVDGLAGKFGINAIGGIECSFDLPLTLFADFRPGYGLFFDSVFASYGGLTTKVRSNTNFFDWGIGIGARYCFY